VIVQGTSLTDHFVMHPAKWIALCTFPTDTKMAFVLENCACRGLGFGLCGSRVQILCDRPVRY